MQPTTREPVFWVALAAFRRGDHDGKQTAFSRSIAKEI